MSITTLPAAPPRASVVPFPRPAPPLLELDRGTREVSVRGRQVALAPMEFRLLEALAERPAHVLSKERLLRDVWQYAHPVATRTVDSHACRLRRRLDDPRLVHNVRGIGYRLVAPLDVGRVRVGERPPERAEPLPHSVPARHLSLVRCAPPGLDFAQLLLGGGAGPLVVQGSREAVTQQLNRAAADGDRLVALRTLDGPLVSVNPRHVVLVTGDEAPGGASGA